MATLSQVLRMSFRDSNLVSVGKWAALVIGFGYGTMLRNERTNARIGGLTKALEQRDAKIRELLIEKKYPKVEGVTQEGSDSTVKSTGDPLTDWINSMTANN